MPKSDVPAVSFVIPSWNGLDFLKVVLPSLAAQTATRTETIVVDNGSSDRTVPYLERYWPKVRVVALPENRGFAGAMNEGIAVARGALIALLNNDLELAPDWTARMQSAAESNPDAGMFAGKLLRFDRRDVIDGVGETVSWYSTTLKLGHGERDEGQYDRPAWRFGPNAAAALYRRELFERVGTFDADFFAYLEDSDLHFRAQLAGLRCRYVPEARAYHIGGATSGTHSRTFLYYWHRNRIWLVQKNFPAGELLKHLPKLWFAGAKTLLGAIKRRELWVILRAWTAAWLALPRTLAKRRTIQRSRAVPNRYLREIVSNEFGEPSRLLDRLRRGR